MTHWGQGFEGDAGQTCPWPLHRHQPVQASGMTADMVGLPSLRARRLLGWRRALRLAGRLVRAWGSCLSSFLAGFLVRPLDNLLSSFDSSRLVCVHICNSRSAHMRGLDLLQPTFLGRLVP